MNLTPFHVTVTGSTHGTLEDSGGPKNTPAFHKGSGAPLIGSLGIPRGILLLFFLVFVVRISLFLHNGKTELV